jgi:hypothetical protein
VKATKDIAATLPAPHKTKKGARLDLAVYVYPDGHGNITGGKGSSVNVVCNDAAEAMIAFAAMWREARKAR